MVWDDDLNAEVSDNFKKCFGDLPKKDKEHLLKIMGSFKKIVGVGENEQKRFSDY